MVRYFFIVMMNAYVLCMAGISFEKSIYELSDADVYAVWHHYKFNAEVQRLLTCEIKRRSLLEISLKDSRKEREGSCMVLIPYKKHYLKIFKLCSRELGIRHAAERVYGAEYLRFIIKKYGLSDYLVVPRKMVGLVLGYPAVIAERFIAVSDTRVMPISEEHVRALCILLKESQYCDISEHNVFVVYDKDGLYKVAIIDTEIRSFYQKETPFGSHLKHRVPEEYHTVIDAYA